MRQKLKRDEVGRFLKDFLNVRRTKDEIEREAAARQISKHTLEEYRRDFASFDRKDVKWYWDPKDAPAPAQLPKAAWPYPSIPFSSLAEDELVRLLEASGDPLFDRIVNLLDDSVQYGIGYRDARNDVLHHIADIEADYAPNSDARKALAMLWKLVSELAS